MVSHTLVVLIECNIKPVLLSPGACQLLCLSPNQPQALDCPSWGWKRKPSLELKPVKVKPLSTKERRS